MEWIHENAPGCKEITWTGGEPLDQLNHKTILWFGEQGFYNAVETSGIRKDPGGIDFICLSPKVAEHVCERHFPLRYVRHAGQQIPQPKVKAEHHWISPHSDGWEINATNLKHCIELCLKNPKWKLSVQDHKIWKVL